jgi:signal transduction histidine kinase
MTASELLKRTPVRLAVAFTALFAVTAVVLIAILFFSLSAELEDRIRARVQETADTLAAIDDEKGMGDLTAVVSRESLSFRDTESIYLLVDDDGKFLAGNVRDISDFPGWTVLDRASLSLAPSGGDPDDSFHAIWTPVSKGRLLVGGSDREIRVTQGLLLNGLGWGLAATALLAAAFGAVLAWRAQQRINALASTLSDVSRGQITSRVPLSGSNDDIDHIGEQINRTLGHLQSLIESVNQASSDIAHDLKKPIGRVRQRLDLVRRDAGSAEEYQEAVASALVELDSIVETFEALLRITQIEAGARKARFEPLELAAVLQDVVEIYAAVVEDAGDRLECSIDLPRNAIIRGDRELLVQLFANLIENAVRHCRAGTLIRLSAADHDDRLVVELSDDGPGIPAAERENVFRRLYRLERARSTPGSGLGLSLVAAITDLHDATIELADNRPGLRVTMKFSKSPA